MSVLLIILISYYFTVASSGAREAGRKEGRKEASYISLSQANLSLVLTADKTLNCDPGDLVIATPGAGTIEPDLLRARQCTKCITYLISLSHPQNPIRSMGLR